MKTLRVIYKLLALFESNHSQLQLTTSLLIGFWLGIFSPLTLQWWVSVVLLFVLRTNLILLLASALFWSVQSQWLEPHFHQLGLKLLSKDFALQHLWLSLYEAPVVPYTRFYVTSYLGALVFALVTSVPFFFLFSVLTKKLTPNIYHFWRGTKFYRIYAFYKMYTK